MNDDHDRDIFIEQWSAASEVLSGKEQSPAACLIAYRVLRKHSLKDVLAALAHHLDTADWMCAPKHINEIIDPPKPELTNAELLGLARAADSPLGVWVRYRISQHSLQTWPERQLLTHLETLRAEIDQFIAEGLRGEFSDDAKRVLGSYEFSNRTELAPGLPVQRTMPRLEVVQ